MPTYASKREVLEHTILRYNETTGRKTGKYQLCAVHISVLELAVVSLMMRLSAIFSHGSDQ